MPSNEPRHRLHFTAEERAAEEPVTPKRRRQRSFDKMESEPMQPQHEEPKAEKLLHTEPEKKPSRLRFESEERKRPSKLVHVVTQTPAALLHRQVEQSEDENVGVEAAHTGERAAESVYELTTDVIRRSPKSSKQKSEGAAQSSASKTTHSGRLYYREERSQQTAQESSGKRQQRNRIKRQYAAEKRSASTAGGTVTETAARTVKERAQQILRSLSKGKTTWLLLGGFALILVMLFQSFSSCGNFGIGGMQAILNTSFLSEDSDLLAVERQYAKLEDQLDKRLENIEREYAGYDEYHYDIDEIGHNPYALLAYLTAKHVAFTPNEVKQELTVLFDRQYKLVIEESVEIRYREERLPVPTIDPNTGKVVETKEVSYEYKTLSVELRNRGLEAAIDAALNDEQQELYRVLLETRGNKPELFSSEDSPYVGDLNFTPPVPYEIPPAALADPQFATLIAEANKYLGYPYVWGGSKPSTSFDCSGFTCWVLNQSGVASVGRTNARGLYKRSTVVSRDAARPGDLIFFTGARAAEIGHPVTHVGIYVGDGMMIHCAGNGVEYKSIYTKYYKKHFYAFGRLG